jgi:hypothetical protein
MKLLAITSIALTAALATAYAALRAGIASPFEVRVFQHLALYQDYAAILPFLAILLLALLPTLRAAGERAAAWCGDHPAWLAIATAAALALGTHAVYHAHALSLDESLALFQSRIFAAGRLAGQFPPELVDWLVPADFRGKFLVVARDGAVASAYWPGFALLLAPFGALGVPWLLNPVLGGASVLVAHRLALALGCDARAAGLVTLLTLGSQAVTINALSYYAMPAHLLASGLYVLLLLARTPARAFLAGVVGSFALVLHNPVPHLLLCLPWILWLAWQPQRWKLLGALAAGYLPLSLALGWGWALYLASLESGQPLSLGDALQVFGGRVGSAAAWAHGSMLEMRLLDFGKLWLWSAPALVAAAVLGVPAAWSESGAWRALLGAGVLTYAGYFLLPFAQGHGWGYRYFHSAWLVLPLVAVVWARPRPALAGYLAACALLSLVLLTTLRALQVEQFIARHVAQLPAARQADAHFIFVDLRGGYYVWDLVQNDPFLRNRPMLLYSRGFDADRALMAARYPDARLLKADARGSIWGKP